VIERLDPTHLKEKINYHQTFEADQGHGVLINGRIKILPLVPWPDDKRYPLFILAPGSISFVRESANSKQPPPDFDPTKKVTPLILELKERENLWVNDADSLKIVDVLDRDYANLILRYTSAGEVSVEKIHGVSFGFRPFEVEVDMGKIIILASSARVALRVAGKNHKVIDKKSVRELKFEEGFEKLLRKIKVGRYVPDRLLRYFGLDALHDSSSYEDFGIPDNFYQVTGELEREKSPL